MKSLATLLEIEVQTIQEEQKNKMIYTTLYRKQKNKKKQCGPHKTIAGDPEGLDVPAVPATLVVPVVLATPFN